MGRGLGMTWTGDDRPAFGRHGWQRLLAALLLAAALLALAGCGGGSSADGEAGVLRRGTASEPPSLDPHVAIGNSASTIVNDLFMGLATRNREGRTVPGIAESYEVSADGLTWRFRLRPGLRWSDGTPMTAEDVVWSFRRLMQPETGARYAANLYVIRNGRAVNRGAPPETLGVRAPDPQTVEFTLERPVPYFLRVLNSNATVPVPRHVIEREGRNWTRPGVMVSNGAFRLAEWVPNTRIVLDKNENFHEADRVALNRVVYFPTDDTASLVRRFRSGEVDIVLNFPPDQAEFLEKTYPGQVKAVSNYGLYYYMFNTGRPPFNDVRVRRALALAVDRDAIVQRILKGDSEPAWTLVPSDISGYRRLPPPDAARPFAERQAEARRLLAEAGFGPARPLTFELTYDTKEESRQIALAVTDMWKAVGVEPKLVATDFRGVTNSARSGRYDMIRYQWFAPYDDPSTFFALVRSGSPTNLSGYGNPEAERLVAAADGLADPEERMRRLAEAERAIMADWPLLPLYFTSARRLVAGRVEGWVDAPGGNVASRFLSVKGSG